VVPSPLLPAASRPPCFCDISEDLCVCIVWTFVIVSV
jgi:hypothetical protein